MATTTAISFARGAPSLDIVDVEDLRAAVEEALREDPAGAVGYGTAIGYPPLREWIADLHGVPVERVVVTNGSMQADAFLFDELIGAGDTAVVERPTYDRTLLLLREHGADVRMVALDENGIDVDELERLLDAGVRPKLVHVIPNFQNPAGYTLSEQRRRRLVDLAATHGFTLFEDDPYRRVRFAGEPLPTLLELDQADRVIHASSFSKTVCPGVRVGYLVGPEEMIARIVKRATETYIAPNMFAQATVYRFCTSGAIDRSIETVCKALGERVDALAAALERHLPTARFRRPEGGYFMWVTLPEGTDTRAVLDVATRNGVTFVAGSDFLLEGGENTLRLSYAGVPAEQMDEGVRRLAEAVAAAGQG